MSFSPYFPENQDQIPNKFAEVSMRERFHRIFSHSWDFIEQETPESRWKTITKYKLTEQKLWYKYIDPELILGVRFGRETNYGMCDLDWGSVYDPREQEESLRVFKWELENYGIIRFVFLQSSFSRGLHLYFFLERPVNTFRLACVMTKAAVEAGLKIKNGHFEILPNTKAYDKQFQGHRLPLQEGSYLLDEDYTPYSDRLEDFLDAADWSAAGNDVDLLESRLEESYEWYKSARYTQDNTYQDARDKEFLEQIEYAQREIQEGFFNKIRICVEKGFDDFHQTNDLLLTIGKLGRLLHGLKGDRLVAYIKETVVSCPGYAQYCRHKHEILRRCQEVARWAENKWSCYRSTPKNRITYTHIKDSLTNKTNRNQERQINAQSRIIQAIEHIIREKGKLPRKVGERINLLRTTTKELFGISVSDATLKKSENLSLWHPKHRIEDESNEILIQTLLEEGNEQDTAEFNVVEVQPESNNSMHEVLDSGKSSVVLNEPVRTQHENDKDVLQKQLQLKSGTDKQHEKQSTPCHVVRKESETQNPPKSAPFLVFHKTVYTLSYMKGSVFDMCEAFYRYVGKTVIATVWKPGGIIELESIQPNQIIEIISFKGFLKHETQNIEQAQFAMVKPKNSDWESGIQIRCSELEKY